MRFSLYLGAFAATMTSMVGAINSDAYASTDVSLPTDVFTLADAAAMTSEKTIKKGKPVAGA